MDRLYQFAQIGSEQLLSVGQKAYHLSLVQQQASIVPGVVIPAEWLKTTIAAIDWSTPLLVDLPTSLLHLDLDDGLQLRAIARHIRQTIATAPVPDDWATQLDGAIAPWAATPLILRPSLVVAPKPGYQGPSTQPEVVCRTASLIHSRLVWSDRGAIVTGLKQLWGDLFGAKSLFYWQQQNLPLYRVHLAVIAQPLLPAIASGTLTARETQLEIAAVLGLGHGLSRGEMRPDIYQIQRETGTVIAQTLGHQTIAYRVAPGTAALPAPWLEPYVLAETQKGQPALSAAQLQHLAELGRRVMEKVGPRFTLEWLIVSTPAGDRLYVTQIMPTPITPTQIMPTPPTPPGAIAPLAKPDPPAGATPPAGALLLAQGVPAAPGQVTAQAHVLEAIAPSAAPIPPGRILVAPTIPLPWLPLLQQAAAVITQQGGQTSHSAIVARDLGIPAVMGVPGATDTIATGDWLWVDGNQGQVYRLSSPEKLKSRSRLQTPNPQPDAADLPRIRTRLMVNVHQPEHLSQLGQWPVAGIGLLRSELLAMTTLNQQHPRQWLTTGSRSQRVEEWANAIAQFAQALPHQPIFYRSFDLRRHEFQVAPPPHPEAGHAMLGIRGTLSYQLSPELFRLELEALAAVRQAGYTNVHLLLPFVRTVEEFQFCHQLARQAGLTAQADFQLWIMAEVPSILLLLPDYVAAGVQGISIGSNDLTQLLLGVDRDDATLAEVFEDRHPAVQRAIAQLCKQAQELGIPCSICGDAPVRHRELIHNLIRWGIDSISVPPTAIEAVFWEIVRAEHNLLSRTPRSP